MNVYRVDTPAGPRLVRAHHKNHARNYVCDQIVVARIATQDDMRDLHDVKIETLDRDGVLDNALPPAA